MTDPSAGDTRARARSRRRRGGAKGSNPAAAGALLVTPIVLLGAAGLGIGALVGFPVPFAFAGLLAGLVVGFAIVYSRFRDI
jgi:hypothetical protein